MSRPGGFPSWATGAAIVTTPTAAKQAVGWKTSEKPPAQFMNWLFNLIYLWIVYFDDGIIAAKAADTNPIWQFQDANFNTRSFVGASGFPIGPMFSFKENWVTVSSLSGGSSANFGSSMYYQTNTSAASAATLPPAFFTGLNTSSSPLRPYPLPICRVVTNIGITATSRVGIISQAAPVIFAPQCSIEMVFDAGVDSATSDNTSYFWGFSKNLTAATLLNSAGLYFDPSFSANWQLLSFGSVSLITDTGIPAVGNQMVRAKVTLYGSATPQGRKIVFTVNGTDFTVTTTTNIPIEATGFANVGDLFFGFSSLQDSGSSALIKRQFCGPISIDANSFLDGLY